MSNVVILEDLIRFGQIKAIKDKYLKQALLEGPEVYYRYIVNHEMNDPMSRWDVMIMCYLSCSLINDLSLELSKEAALPQILDNYDMIGCLVYELVDGGRAWCHAAEERKRAHEALLKQNPWPSYADMKKTSLSECQVTEEFLIMKMKPIIAYVEEMNIQHLFGCWPCIKVQIDAIRK